MIPAHSIVRACIVALAVSGCTMRDSSASESAKKADRVEAVESMQQAPDQAAPILIDSSAQGTPPPADASGNLTGETTKKGGTLGEGPPRRDSIIGRDSAFGPIGTMDSNGTVRPIRK